jgi:hypothetical protein
MAKTAKYETLFKGVKKAEDGGKIDVCRPERGLLLKGKTQGSNWVLLVEGPKADIDFLGAQVLSKVRLFDAADESDFQPVEWPSESIAIDTRAFVLGWCYADTARDQKHVGYLPQGAYFADGRITVTDGHRLHRAACGIDPSVAAFALPAHMLSVVIRTFVLDPEQTRIELAFSDAAGCGYLRATGGAVTTTLRFDGARIGAEQYLRPVESVMELAAKVATDGTEDNKHGVVVALDLDVLRESIGHANTRFNEQDTVDFFITKDRAVIRLEDAEGGVGVNSPVVEMEADVRPGSAFAERDYWIRWRCVRDYLLAALPYGSGTVSLCVSEPHGAAYLVGEGIDAAIMPLTLPKGDDTATNETLSPRDRYEAAEFEAEQIAAQIDREATADF